MNKYIELENCNICPRKCGVNRYETTGFCKASAEVCINLAQLHYGEEPSISGTRGSGTVFFSHCNLKCVFCQNSNISMLGWGEDKPEAECVQMMLDLQTQGAHNINLVTPTHFSIQLIDIIRTARAAGLTIPILWNSNAFELVETLERLDGLIDIYMPDMKFAFGVHGELYTNAFSYPSISRKVVKEMFKQVGNLQVNGEGIAEKGLIIRLLVMPNGVSGTVDTLQWIGDELGDEVQLSIMAQYYPAYRASQYQEICRGISQAEYDTVMQKVYALGFHNVYLQELSADAEWTPDFKNY